MIPGRTTRSTNNSLPRKRYTNYANSNYAESAAQSAQPSSEDDSDSDSDDIPAEVGPSTAKAKPNGKRKQPAKPATKKGKEPAKPPAKRQRRGGPKAMVRKSPGIDYSTTFTFKKVFPETTSPDLPDLPASTYAPSAIGEWTDLSDRIMHGQDEELEAEGGSEPQQSQPMSNEEAIQMLQAVMKAKNQSQEQVINRLRAMSRSRRSMSRSHRSKSIEWVDIEGAPQDEVEEQAHAQHNEELQLGVEFDPAEIARLGIEAFRQQERERGNDEAYERWISAKEQTAPPDPDNGKGAVDDDDDGVASEAELLEEAASQGREADALRPHPDENPPAGLAEWNAAEDADDDMEQIVVHAEEEEEEEEEEVHFGSDYDPPEDIYDVDDQTAAKGQSERDEESLFVPDVLQDDNVASNEEVEAGDDGQGQNPNFAGDKEEHDGQEDHEDERPRTPPKRPNFASSATTQRGPPETPLPSQDHSRPSFYFEPEVDETMALLYSRDLTSLLKCMKTQAWTKDGVRWEADLLSGYNKHLSAQDRKDINLERREMNLPPIENRATEATMWYNEHRDEVRSIKAREMIQHVYRAWHTYRDAPSAADLEAQVEYFTIGKGKGIQKALEYCEKYVGYFCKRLPAEDKNKLRFAKCARESLTHRLIPLMVVTLKEAFLLASTRSKSRHMKLDHVQDVPRTVDVTEYHMQMMLRITSMLHKLCAAVISEHTQNKPDPLPENWQTQHRQRWNALERLAMIQKTLRKAIETRDEAINEPSRKRRAQESDRLERERKEARLQREREAHKRQFELFSKSLQTVSSQRQNQMSSSTPMLYLSQTLLKKPKRKRLSPKEEYARKNDGWYYDEDDTLLNALRRVEQPNARHLAESLKTNRTPAQINRRLMELREIGRRTYMASGKAIPRWCQGWGWR